MDWFFKILKINFWNWHFPYITLSPLPLVYTTRSKIYVHQQWEDQNEGFLVWGCSYLRAWLLAAGLQSARQRSTFSSLPGLDSQTESSGWCGCTRDITTSDEQHNAMQQNCSTKLHCAEVMRFLPAHVGIAEHSSSSLHAVLRHANLWFDCKCWTWLNLCWVGSISSIVQVFF